MSDGLTENFKPQSELEQEVISWKEKLMTNLNGMEKLKKDDQKNWREI